MTAFIAAYDTERSVTCLKASKQIARLHRERGIPATFYIVGRLLEEEGTAYKDLLDDAELFEIASHTYSHKLLLDRPWRVVPDTGSLILVTPLFYRNLVVENEPRDGMSGIQLWYTCVENVVAAYETARTYGSYSRG